MCFPRVFQGDDYEKERKGKLVRSACKGAEGLGEQVDGWDGGKQREKKEL